MKRIRKHSGFSLMEMLIATGIMAIGLVMVATIFPVGVKLTALTTERTIGAVVADEAFAKIQLYGLRDFVGWPTNPNQTQTCTSFRFVSDLDWSGSTVGVPDGVVNILDTLPFEWGEFLYPSASMQSNEEYRYHWSALCRKAGDKDVQVTVFVNRKSAPGALYYGQSAPLVYNLLSPNPSWPSPVAVSVTYNSSSKRGLVINGGPGTLTAAQVGEFFDDGYTIVDDYTGRIYRILEVNRIDKTLVLTEDFRWLGYENNPLTPPASQMGLVWVVPPAVGSDRYPCVGVYQKVIRFNEIQ